MSEILNLSSICRCCHSDGVFKNLDTPYVVENRVEIYSVMLQETIGLSIIMPNLEVSKAICEECVMKLRDVFNFKQQVIACEQKFLEYCKNEEALIQTAENIKTEWDTNNDDFTNVEDVSQEYREENLYKLKIETEQREDKKYEVDGKLRKPPVESDSPLALAMSTATDGGEHACHLCDARYPTTKSLSIHITLKHENYVCEVCDSIFKWKSQLRDHVTTEHNNAKLHKCRRCPKKFLCKKTLADHIELHHTKTNSFQCDICQKMFRYKQSLKQHLKWHAGESKKVMCEICGGSFNDQSNLKSHIQTVHEKLRLFKCTLCPKAFAANKTLKVHMRNHTGERPYSCEICPKTFTSFTSYRKHNERHDPEFVYRCKVCPKTFKNRGEFSKHTQLHVGYKPLICDTCGKDFTCHYSLKRHKLDHSGLKPFACDQCTWTFSQKSVMERHKKRVHNGLTRSPSDRKQCDLCKRLVYNMEKHLQSHNNRPHVCEYCSKTYAERNVLNRHVLSVHYGKKCFPCQYCDKKYKQSNALKHHNLKVHKMPLKTELEENMDSIVTKYTIPNKYRKKKLCTNNLTLDLTDGMDQGLS